MEISAQMLILICALFVTGCDGSVPPEKRSSKILGHEALQPKLVNSINEIKGQWDVVSFEGYRPKRLNGSVRAAVADFGDQFVSLRIECNYTGRTGTVQAGRFVLTGRDDMPQTVMSCAPERAARDVRYFSFFKNSPSVEHLGENSLRLQAGKSQLILERPSIRRLAYLPTHAKLQGKWQMMELQRTLPDGGHAGIGLSEISGRIAILADQISFEPCPNYAVTYQLSQDGRLIKRGGTAPATPKDCSALDKPKQAPILPHEPEVLRLLHASPLVEMPEPDQLLLSAGEHSLYLVRVR